MPVHPNLVSTQNVNTPQDEYPHIHVQTEELLLSPICTPRKYTSPVLCALGGHFFHAVSALWKWSLAISYQGVVSQTLS